MSSKAEQRIQADLTVVIAQAVPQVYGSDERALLEQWLARNGGQEQQVILTLPLKGASTDDYQG